MSAKDRGKSIGDRLLDATLINQLPELLKKHGAGIERLAEERAKGAMQKRRDKYKLENIKWCEEQHGIQQAPQRHQIGMDPENPIRRIEIVLVRPRAEESDGN